MSSGAVSVGSSRKVGLGLNLERRGGDTVVTNIIPGFGAIKVVSSVNHVLTCFAEHQQNRSLRTAD